MRSEGFGFEFGMKLATQEPWMISQFDDLHEILIGRHAGNNQTLLREIAFKRPVEFVTMAMALGDDRRLVNSIRQRAFKQVCRICAESHRAPDRIDTQKVSKLVNNRVRGVDVEFGA